MSSPTMRLLWNDVSLAVTDSPVMTNGKESNRVTAEQYNASQLQKGILWWPDITVLTKAWQTAHPPLSVDGELGPDTLASIRGSTPLASGLPTTPTVGNWVPYLDKYRAQLPLPFLLNWIQAESGGNPCALGIPGVEAGIFQTYHPDDDHYGQTFAENRVVCTVGSSKPTRALTEVEADLQAKAGVAYVQSATDVSRRHLAAVGCSGPKAWTDGGTPGSSGDLWKLVKLRHNLPVFGAVFLPAFAKATGAPPRDWTQFKAYVLTLSQHDFSTIAPSATNFWAGRAHLFDIAEKVGTF